MTASRCLAGGGVQPPHCRQGRRKGKVTGPPRAPQYRVGNLMDTFMHALYTNCSSTMAPVAPPRLSGTSEHRHSHRKGSPSTVFLRERKRGMEQA